MVLCYRVLVWYMLSKIIQLLRTLGDVLRHDMCSKMIIFVQRVYTQKFYLASSDLAKSRERRRRERAPLHMG